jgi:hypothetical protein
MWLTDSDGDTHGNCYTKAWSNTLTSPHAPAAPDTATLTCNKAQTCFIEEQNQWE